MKKIDKLVLQAFLGPFVLTFCVVVFILLTQTMLKYFDEFVGKGLGPMVFAELIFYFSLNVTPVALPLAVLLSSLIAFGNLGEHFELTAIKSAGISLVRVLVPIFIFAVGITFAAFWFNDYIVPKANLNAYSLLYDIRTKKANFNIKEGIFYNGLPGYSIKANKNDGKIMKGLMIYDHTRGNGNTELILADSGSMRTIENDRYLLLELYNGKNYSDQRKSGSLTPSEEFMRNDFRRSRMIFDMSSFNLSRTKKELFSDNRMMKNINQLNQVSDSLGKEYKNTVKYVSAGMEQYYMYHQKKARPGVDTIQGKWVDSVARVKFTEERFRKEITNRAVTQARNIKSFIETSKQRRHNIFKERNQFTVEKFRKYTQAIACLIMFLIGAPLGSIIKKGGLGVPVLISIVFFIVFYVLSIIGEKWSKEGVVEIPYGMWAANFILFWVGLVFLRQARNDSRLFEADVYIAAFSRFLSKLRRMREGKAA